MAELRSQVLAFTAASPHSQALTEGSATDWFLDLRETAEQGCTGLESSTTLPTSEVRCWLRVTQGLSAWVCSAPAAPAAPSFKGRGLDCLPVFPTSTQRMRLARQDPWPCRVWSGGKPILHVCVPGTLGSLLLQFFLFSSLGCSFYSARSMWGKGVSCKLFCVLVYLGLFV